MGHMQDKIMAELRRIAVDAGLDLADQAQCGNTGTVHIMHGLDTAGLADNLPLWQALQAVITWHHLMFNDGARLRSLPDVFGAVLATTAEQPTLPRCRRPVQDDDRDLVALPRRRHRAKPAGAKRKAAMPTARSTAHRS